jgi:predicted nucleic acid-binding protein
LILLDTSGLLAVFDRAARVHEQARVAFEHESSPLVVSPFVLAELDYLAKDRLGTQQELQILAELASGAYELPMFDKDDLVQAREIVQRYSDLGIGLTDASLVVLAGRYGTERILTLDERHFRALRAPHGKPFTLLPADSTR